MIQNKMVRRHTVGKSFRGYTYLPFVSRVVMVKAPMPTVVADLIAYGTSEGAKKAWETRGRGRKELPKIPPKQLIKNYKDIGTELSKVHGKLHDFQDVHSLAGRFLHVLKAIGEWGDSVRGLSELAMGAYATLKIATFQFAGEGNYLHHVLSWAYRHVMPTVQSLAHVHGVVLRGGL